jgi:uncharacterized protein YecE (DUF72 family)
VSNLRIGTSGWNYPSGKGSWNGIFYPRAAKRRRTGAGSTSMFDELAYYAEHFDTVEINSTFYGPPRAAVARTWVDRTPPGFEFSLKLYRKLTHEVAGALRPDSALIDEYRAGIEPMARADRIGALLAQFPPSFKQSPESQAYLDALLACFQDYPVAVELRHRSWSDKFDETLSLLNSWNAALAQIDEPKFKLSIRQNQLPNIATFYYMRLHGRNAANWWRHEKAEDRYNYLYSGDELKSFSATADAARRLVRKFYLYFNNHFASKSVVNAVMIKNQLGEPIPGTYPQEFVDRYPEVASMVSTALPAELSRLY